MTLPSDDQRSRLTAGEKFCLALLALIAYVPLLLSSPREISADTKAYLLLNPTKLLERAPFLWDSHIDAGTVTHQNIGYLFPLGPWYWMFDTIGVPTWIAERLWFGTLLLAAGAGTLWMLRKLGLRGPGPAVAAFAYMLSPYLLSYMGRTSVILTPWCALPWLIGLMACALRERTWRAPLFFALIVTAVAGTNASSVIFVLLGPLLFVPCAIWITRETDGRDALRSLLRIAIATAPAQVWWLSGLYVQGKFGLPILQLTETVETVAQTSTAPEALRGLGYWYFYGKDGLASWTESSRLFTTTIVMLPLSFILPLLGLLGAVLTRWKYRSYFVGLILVGLVGAIGTYPYMDPSPLGSVIKFTTSLEAGFALRNSPRIIPLLALGLAAMIASFVNALVPELLSRYRSPINRRLAAALPIGLICIAILNLPPLWTGKLVQPDLKFPETIPSYWTEAATWLDSQSTDLRVLELPGADFAAYRWGETQDPVTPGLIDRPWIGREITAYGTPPSVDLLRALDRTLQEGVGEISAVKGIAQLLSASDVLLRLDSQYERYRGPRPTELWTQFGEMNPSNGLGAPTTFGAPVVNTPDLRQPMIDEQRLAMSGSQTLTPPLAVYPVEGVRPILRAESTSTPTILFGDGDGIVSAASWNQLPTERALIYAATASQSPKFLAGIRASQPNLVITDTNRKRAQRWGTTRENNGATETAASKPLVKDPKDTRLELFPGENSGDQSVAWFGEDVANVRATSYGNIVAYSTEVRPANAIDGNPRTAWTTGGFSDATGDRIVIDYTRPITADHIDLLQPQGNRWITKATILLDGVPTTTIAMNDTSFSGVGQRVEIPESKSFTSLSIRIDETNVMDRTTWLGFSNVGFREITVPGVSSQEWIVTPKNGIDELAPESANVSYLFSRIRSNPIESFRQDSELQIRRIFHVGSLRQFLISGRARLNSGVDGSAIDSIVGRPGTSDGFPIVEGTDFLDGAFAARPSSALDGNSATAWTTKFGNQVGASATIISPEDLSFDHLDLVVVNDKEHSVPTSLELTLDDGTTRLVNVPEIQTSETLGSQTAVVIPTGPLVSKVVRIAIASTRDVTTKEYFSGQQHALPIAIAEFGLPTQVAPLPDRLPSTCRNDLLRLDSNPRTFVVSGTVLDALGGKELELLPCGDSTVPAPLDAGDHRVETSPGTETGIDVNSLQLQSIPMVAATPPFDTPKTETVDNGGNSYSIGITDASSPFWLVLGQSLSPGWKATVRGGASLGEPLLIDGFANGWLVDPALHGSTLTVDLDWTPQKFVWAGLAISILWFAGLCLAVIIISFRRRKGSRPNALRNDPVLAKSHGITKPNHLIRVGLLLGIVASSALLGGLGVAVSMAAISSLLLWTRRRVAIAALTVMGSIGGIVLLYTGLQLRRAYTTGVEWPSGFLIAHQLGLIAVLVVVAETVIRRSLRVRSNETIRVREASQINDGSPLTR
ncbi:MAG: alpha-(1-_3)-arabinofuranosyltransferase family protein [Acidimicrobiales bacterium]